MPKKSSEIVLRVGFICSAVLILTISATYSWYTEEKELLILKVVEVRQPVHTFPKKDNGIGILTYIKRNYKRWRADIRENPEKWLRFKIKLEKLLNSTTSSDKKGQRNARRQ